MTRMSPAEERARHTELERARHTELERARRAKLRAAGKCYACGGQGLPCAACNAYAAARMRASRARRKAAGT